MKNNLSTHIIVLLLIFILGGCQIAPVRVVQHKEAIQLPPGIKPPPIQLKKVLTRIPIGEQIGQTYYGWGCSAGAKMSWNGGRLAISDEEMTQAFKTELGSAGYVVAGNPDSVFNSEVEAPTDLQVGGAITQIESNICHPFSGNPLATTGNPALVKGGLYLKVSWELYSRSAQKVILKATTEGTFQAAETQPGGVAGFLLGAFKENISGLMANPDFQRSIVNVN